MGVQVVDDFLEGVAEGAHAHDDAIGIFGTVVIEQVIARAELLVHLVHVVLDDRGQVVVRGVAGLTVLEEDVAVLVGTAVVRMVGVERVVTERLHGSHVDHLGEIVVIPHGDLLDLVRGAEAVEEVQERNLALDGGKVRHRGEVHDLLDVGLGEHGEAGLAAGHDVGVITEDVERMAGDGTRGHVEHARQMLACDLVHVRDHEQKTLGRGVGGGQRARDERAMDGARGAGLGLHLDDVHLRAKDVLLALSCPLVDMVGHRAGRRNRVDTRNFGERIRYVCGGLVAVHGLELTRHIPLSSRVGIQSPVARAYRLFHGAYGISACQARFGERGETNLAAEIHMRHYCNAYRARAGAKVRRMNVFVLFPLCGTGSRRDAMPRSRRRLRGRPTTVPAGGPRPPVHV